MSARILVVDDEPHTRRLVALQLERQGYRVDTARNGVEALEALRGSRYDAVVTDFSMPEMNGRELCETIRGEIGTDLPLIVLMTSQVSDEVGDWLSSLSNARFFERPVSLRRLTRLLESDLAEAGGIVNEESAKLLNLAGYSELTASALGEEIPLLLCDAEGAPLWTSEGCSGEALTHLVGQLGVDGFASETDLAGVDDDVAVVSAPVRDERGEARAWLASAVAADAALSETALRRKTLLTRLASCLEREALRGTETLGLAEELADRNEEINIVYEFEKRAVQGLGPAEFHEALQDVAETLRLDLAVAIVRGKIAAPVGSDPLEPIDNLDLLLLQLRNHLFRFLKARRSPLVMNEPDDERRAYLFGNMAYRLLAYPLHEEGVVHGMLVMLRHPERPHFSNSDFNLVATMARRTEFLLRQFQMSQRLERFSQEMASALIEAVEAKDPYTRGHSERVQGIAVEIGAALALTQHEVDDVRWGALLHDIGKIGIPDAILSKPGKLSQDEYTFIQTHPERTYEILLHIKDLRTGTLEGARYHHERIDGKGYPRGLRGDEIPQSARIIAVADTYDAITTSRSYRAARSQEQALEVIEEVAGTQLDAAVVEAFARLCAERGEAIRRITATRGD